MKTIRKGTDLLRVSDQEAATKVKTQNYNYVPKSVWKKSVRDRKKDLTTS